MKKISVLLIAFALGAGSLVAQDVSNVIKVNPLGLLFGQASVSYERALSEKSSFMVSGLYGSFKTTGAKYTQIGGMLSYRLYLSKKNPAPEGFYLSPGIKYNSGKTKTESLVGGGSSETKFTSFGGQLVIGRQWIWDSGFTIDLNGGVGYRTFKYKGDALANTVVLKGNGIVPVLTFALGYAF